MKNFTRLFLIVFATCLHALAVPIGICLHAYSPEAPADKIECFEYERTEKITGGTRFFLPNGRTTVITDYRNRGVILYPDKSPDPARLLEDYEKQARQSPATRQFLNPWILKLRNSLAETSKLAEEIAQLPSITLPDGTVLKGCRVTKTEESLVTVTHTDGIKKLRISDLSNESKKALNLASPPKSVETGVATIAPEPEKAPVANTETKDADSQSTRPKTEKRATGAGQNTLESPLAEKPTSYQKDTLPKASVSDNATDETHAASDKATEIPILPDPVEPAQSAPPNVSELHGSVAETKSIWARLVDLGKQVANPWSVGALIALVIGGFVIKKRKQSTPQFSVVNTVIKFRCHHCDAKISAESDQFGAVIDCPSCGRAFVVPSPKASAGGRSQLSDKTDLPRSLPTVPNRSLAYATANPEKISEEIPDLIMREEEDAPSTIDYGNDQNKLQHRQDHQPIGHRIFKTPPPPHQKKTSKIRSAIAVIVLIAGILVVLQWRRTAENDSAKLADIGRKYYFGDGVPQNYSEAAKNLSLSANKGNSLAQLLLGQCYTTGHGVSQDFVEAAKWLRKSAEQGNAMAQVRLSGCYASGKGVNQDQTESAKWCLKSANQGMPEAQYIMAINYANGLGVPKNQDESLKWCRKAADNGVIEAQELLGKDYQPAETQTNKQGLDSTSDRNLTGTSDAFNVWKFRFGASYAQCVSTMKGLKSAGIFSDLSVGTIKRGWLQGAKSIFGIGKSNLGGILSVPCETIDLLCKNDHLVGISLSFSFKSDYPPGIVGRLTRDAESMLESKATIETKEDDVGNRTKTATIRRGSVCVKIEDEPEGAFGPKFEIFVTEP